MTNVRSPLATFKMANESCRISCNIRGCRMWGSYFQVYTMGITGALMILGLCACRMFLYLILSH
jgi:hypothetical protein